MALLSGLMGEVERLSVFFSESVLACRAFVHGFRRADLLSGD